MKQLVATLACMVAIGISGIVAAHYIFYYQGRAGLPLALLLHWGGILVLIAAPMFLLIRAMRQK
jgi:hypothetical protein